jgi:hypothetical protein
VKQIKKTFCLALHPHLFRFGPSNVTRKPSSVSASKISAFALLTFLPVGAARELSYDEASE